MRRRCVRTRKAAQLTRCTSIGTKRRRARSPKRSSLRCRGKAPRPSRSRLNSRFVVVREFWVNEGCERNFEKVFGLDGLWSELLRRSDEYVTTELRVESTAERRYRTFDYWKSHLGFERFREKNQADCDRLSRLIANEGWIEREILLGSFYIDESDADEDTGLVPA